MADAIMVLLAILVSEILVLGVTIINLLCGLNKGVERKIDSVYDLIFDIKKEIFKKPKANNPKGDKPEIIEQFSFIKGRCPKCGALVYSDECACKKCDQKLDWSDNNV